MSKKSYPYTYNAFTSIAFGLFFLSVVFLETENFSSTIAFSKVSFWLAVIGSLILLPMGLVQLITKRTYSFMANSNISYELMCFGIAATAAAKLIDSYISQKTNLISSILWIISIFMLVYLGYKFRYTSQKK